jgi:hypothetical protein
VLGHLLGLGPPSSSPVVSSATIRSRSASIECCDGMWLTRGTNALRPKAASSGPDSQCPRRSPAVPRRSRSSPAPATARPCAPRTSCHDRARLRPRLGGFLGVPRAPRARSAPGGPPNPRPLSQKSRDPPQSLAGRAAVLSCNAPPGLVLPTPAAAPGRDRGPPLRRRPRDSDRPPAGPQRAAAIRAQLGDRGAEVHIRSNGLSATIPRTSCGRKPNPGDTISVRFVTPRFPCFADAFRVGF